MTLLATRRYAFGASVGIGLVAVVMAAVLVGTLVADPDGLLLAMDNADVASLMRVIVHRLVSTVSAILRLL